LLLEEGRTMKMPQPTPNQLDVLVQRATRHPDRRDRDLILILEMLNERVKDLERIVHRQDG
jgi:hypothetical protein